MTIDAAQAAIRLVIANALVENGEASDDEGDVDGPGDAGTTVLVGIKIESSKASAGPCVIASTYLTRSRSPP